MAIPSNYRWVVVGNLAVRNRKNAPHYAPAFFLADLLQAITARIADLSAGRLEKPSPVEPRSDSMPPLMIGGEDGGAAGFL